MPPKDVDRMANGAYPDQKALGQSGLGLHFALGSLSGFESIELDCVVSEPWYEEIII